MDGDQESLEAQFQSEQAEARASAQSPVATAGEMVKDKVKKEAIKKILTNPYILGGIVAAIFIFLIVAYIVGLTAQKCSIFSTSTDCNGISLTNEEKADLSSGYGAREDALQLCSTEDNCQ